MAKLAGIKRNSPKVAKIQLIGGQAKPGPGLASLGINMSQFTKEFNDKTKDRNGDVIPVVFTIFPNKSYTFILKITPTSILLKKAAKIEKGAGDQKNKKVATISKEEITKIAKQKLPDLNSFSIEAAERTIIGTAKQMGIEISS